jgi:hypothetical protein
MDYQKDERGWANRRGGRRQPNSGRFWFAKGDTKDSVLLTDCKETERRSYSITRDLWNSLQHEATKLHLSPHLKLRFVGSDIEVSVIPTALLEQLLDLLESQQESKL